jgi:hypothetical protein
MGKAKELVRLGWSRWYVKGAAFVAIAGFIWIFTLGDYFQGPWLYETLEKTLGGYRHRYRDFGSLLTMQWRLTAVLNVLFIASIVGYVGWTLDAGYKWLCKREQRKPESHKR